MSRAAVKARMKVKRAHAQDRRVARLAAETEKLAREAVEDVMLVRCEGCGLEIVSSGHEEACVMCGGGTATFVEHLPGSHMVAAPLAEAA